MREEQIRLNLPTTKNIKKKSTKTAVFSVRQDHDERMHSCGQFISIVINLDSFFAKKIKEKLYFSLFFFAKKEFSGRKASASTLHLGATVAGSSG